MSDKDIVKDLYNKLNWASINEDIITLNEILSDDYILIHMTGLKQTKNDYIKSVEKKEFKYYEAIDDSIEVDIKENIARVVGKTKVLASPFGMKKSWWRLKQNMTLEKIDGKWLITKSIASNY